MKTIRIEQIKGTPFFHIFIDDMDVSQWTRNVGIEIGADCVPQVTITFLPEHLEIPDELKALVIATREDKKEQEA